MRHQVVVPSQPPPTKPSYRKGRRRRKVQHLVLRSYPELTMCFYVTIIKLCGSLLQAMFELKGFAPNTETETVFGVVELGVYLHLVRRYNWSTRAYYQP